MRKDTRENPVIGWSLMRTSESDRDGEYQELWAHYEPKVRRTASTFCIKGSVGAELEDLMQIGQAVLLHALRRHDPKESRFSTYYYTCLRNAYSHLRKRYFPKRRYIVIASSPNRDRRKFVKCTANELESVLIDLRAQGMVCDIISKSPVTRYPMIENMRYLDAPHRIKGDRDTELAVLGELIADPKQWASVDDIVARINRSVKDPQLHRIAVWLFEGLPMNGKGGIMGREGLSRHQAAKALDEIRKLLAAEFGIGKAGVEK